MLALLLQKGACNEGNGIPQGALGEINPDLNALISSRTQANAIEPQAENWQSGKDDAQWRS